MTEVALVLLEIPLGPLFVFIGFQEAPAVYTVIGCIVLAVTLVGHGVIEARAACRRSPVGGARTMGRSLRHPISPPPRGLLSDLGRIRS